MMMLRRLALALAILALLLVGDAALACPSCFKEAEPEQRGAYIGTTVFLSALPLLLLGFLGMRIYRGSREQAAVAPGREGEVDG
jgi:hypothetical protein